MNKLNFLPQKNHSKKLSKDFTSNNIKSVNKSIENHLLKNNNTSIEFNSNFSPKSKQIKKRSKKRRKK